MIEQVLQALTAIRAKHAAETSRFDAAFEPYDRAVLECIAAVAALMPGNSVVERAPWMPAPCGGMAQNCQWVEGQSTACTCMVGPLYAHPPASPPANVEPVLQFDAMAYAKSIVEAVEQGCTYEDRCLAVRDWLARAGLGRPVGQPVAWLIERRVSPPQWSVEDSPSGVGAFYSDIHRAHRFPTRNDAENAMRRMRITPEERGEYFVSEHVWIAHPPASPTADVVPVATCYYCREDRNGVATTDGGFRCPNCKRTWGYAHLPASPTAKLVQVCQRILDRGYISASIEEERDDYIALQNALAKVQP